MARFSIGGQVVSIIGVFALDSKPLFQASIYYLNHPLNSPLLDYLSLSGLGFKRVGDKFLGGSGMVAFKTFTSDQCFTLRWGSWGVS